MSRPASSETRGRTTSRDEDEERGSSLNRRQDDIAAHDATVQERIEVAKRDILEAIRIEYPPPPPPEDEEEETELVVALPDELTRAIDIAFTNVARAVTDAGETLQEADLQVARKEIKAAKAANLLKLETARTASKQALNNAKSTRWVPSSGMMP